MLSGLVVVALYFFVGIKNIRSKVKPEIKIFSGAITFIRMTLNSKTFGIITLN
jgi:hypothetical protein